MPRRPGSISWRPRAARNRAAIIPITTEFQSNNSFSSWRIATYMSWQGIALGCRVLAQETSHDDAFSFGVGAVDDPMRLCQCRDSESISHTWWLRRWRRGRIQQRAGQQYRD